MKTNEAINFHPFDEGVIDLFTPTFAEMVQQTWEERGRLRDLFHKVASCRTEEGQAFDAEQLRAVFKSRLDPDFMRRKRAKEENLFTTDKPLKGTAKENITALVQTFNLEGDDELKLWRIGCGELSIDWGSAEQMADALIAQPQDDDVRHDFMHFLHQSSGITDPAAAKRIGTTPGIIIQWKVGRTKIESLEQAQKLTDIYVPEFLGPPAELKKKIVKAMTGRAYLNDLDALLDAAEKSSTPVQTLCKSLFSRKSIVNKGVHHVAKKLGIAPHCLYERFNGTTPISEEEAVVMAQLAGANKKQTKRMVDILTQMEGPVLLMQKVIAGKISFTAAAIKIRMRKGASFDDMSERLKIGYIGASNLESGKTVPLKTARILADFFFDKADRKSEEYVAFIFCAVGKEPITKEMLFFKMFNGKIKPLEGLEYIAALEGMSITGWLRAHNFATKHLDEIREHRLTPRMAARFADAMGCSPLTLRHFSENYNGRYMDALVAPSIN